MEEEKKKAAPPAEVKTNTTEDVEHNRLMSNTSVSQTMDETTALDLLSSDFSFAPAAPPPAASAGAATKLEAAAPESEPQKVSQRTHDSCLSLNSRY